MNAKGEITKVYDAESYRRNNATVTQGTPMFDGARGTDKTVYFMIDSANKQYAAYVGYSNVPTKTAIAGYDRIISYDDVNALNAVAIFVSDVGGTTAKDFVYFAGTDKTEVLNENNELVVTYTNVYVNGEKGELKFDSVQSGIQVGDVYEFTTSTKTGLSTLGTERIDGSATGTEITSIQSGYFTVSGNTYVFTDKDTVYYEIDKTNKTVTVVDGLTALSQNDAYSVNKLYNDKGTSVTDAADVVFFYVGE